MSTTDLLLMIDGKPVPLNDVIWEGVGSCGCPFGWHVAVAGGQVLFATPEQAEEELFGENAVIRKFYKDNGATVRATTRGNIPTDRCQHQPAYGLPDADPPEGHEWATTDGTWGRQTHKRHIVPLFPDGMDQDAWQVRRETVALCGKGATRHGSWRSDRTDRFVHIIGKVPCARCIKAVSA